jgi:hypothetical protein
VFHTEVAEMAGSLVPHARFVEIQQRRALIVEALSRSRDPRAPSTRPAAIVEPIDGERPRPDVGAKFTSGAVDGR